MWSFITVGSKENGIAYKNNNIFTGESKLIVSVTNMYTIHTFILIVLKSVDAADATCNLPSLIHL